MADLGPDEIVVVDGGSRDRTVELARRWTDRVEVLPVASRALQLNRGAELASGDVLLFVHADSRLPSDAAAAIRSTLALPGVAGGAFDITIRAPGASYAIIAWAANLRAHRTRIPYGDQAVFLRASRFAELGGFPELPILEDVALSQRLKRSGRIVYLGHRVRNSPRRWEREGIVYATVRNWIITLLFVAGVPVERLVRWYPKIR